MPTSAFDADPRNLFGSYKETGNIKKKNPQWTKLRNGGKRSTLDPADLGCRAVAQLVLGGYPEDDRRAVGGGAVDVGVVQVGLADRAGRLGAPVDPDEGQLARALLAAGAALLHSHVHGVLQDPA